MTKTEQLFMNACPYNNPAQGTAKRLLFVCSAGLLRSPTAATVASKLGYNTRSCGSNKYYALIPFSENLATWANLIIFMNQGNKDEVLLDISNYDFHNNYLIDMIKKKSIVWNIEDDYDYMDEFLVKKITTKLNRME